MFKIINLRINNNHLYNEMCKALKVNLAYLIFLTNNMQ